MAYKLITDRMREIWASSPTLQAAIPVATDGTNRFFADGFPDWITEDQIPNQFVTLEDIGDGLTVAASGTQEERGSPLVLTIVTQSKTLTRDLYDTYRALLKSDLQRSECDLGAIGKVREVNRTFGRLDGGFRTLVSQLNISLRAKN